jgi:hypothetical protein
MVLVTVALFDLVTTMMLLNQGFGESNPLFAPLARMGTSYFVMGKLVFLVGPILLLEFVRTKHPNSAEQGTWIAAAFYGVLYVVHLARHF